jgi:triosephosphate isomerase
MFYLAGNWKMNKSVSEARDFAKLLLNETQIEEQTKIVLLTPALTSFAVSEVFKNSKLRWGGQNCFFENKGAFTGENSPQVLASLGAEFCLVGHSERRQLFIENDELLAKKMKAVQMNGMTPILCVGETLDDRKWRRTNEVIGRQLKEGLALTDFAKDFWIAYEPVWAIGTGQVAMPDQVEEAHSFLREALGSVVGAQKASTTPILYGGSVKSDNAAGLRALNNVNGFLVGGASLEVLEFLKIYRAI